MKLAELSGLHSTLTIRMHIQCVGDFLAVKVVWMSGIYLDGCQRHWLIILFTAFLKLIGSLSVVLTYDKVVDILFVQENCKGHIE